MRKITKEEYGQARDLIATPGRWCQGKLVSHHKKTWNWNTVIDDPKTQFCAIGALYATCRSQNLFCNDLNSVSENLFDLNIMDLNNDEGLDKVLQAYDHLLANWDTYNEAE